MKNIYLTFLFSALYSLSFSQSHDWRPVRTDGTYMFSTGQEYRALRIDSTYSEGDTMKLYGFHELNINEEKWCYNPYGAPWFGKEIINYPDSTVIKNRVGESLVFPMNPEGEWLFFKNATDTVKASVTETKLYTFLGITDSVRIITLNDGSLTYVPIEIWISKNYGMINTPFNLSMYGHSVSADYDFDFLAEIAGIEKEEKGIQPMTTESIYNFEIGDEFHISDYKLEFSSDFYSNNYIQKVIDRAIIANSVINQFQQCQSLGIDTVTKQISLNSVLDSLPFQPILFDDQFLLFFTQTTWNNIPCFQLNYPMFNQFESGCYEPLILKKTSKTYESTYDYFLNGLGGPYFHYNYDNSESFTELVYYKKGTTEWGTPFNCEDLVSVPETESKTLVDVYPNPACEYITVNYQGNAINAVFTLFDISGKIVVSEPLFSGENTLLVDFLPSGLYLGIVKVNNQESYQVKLAKE